MRRLTFLFLLGVLALGVPVAPAADTSVDTLVTAFNPDLWGGDIKMTSTWKDPASNIAKDVLDNFWFSFLVFMPFLVLPQVLLVYAMLKFRDRGDGRKSATFMHNTKLENLWTAIPILALAIVAVPVYPLLYKMELPPQDAENALAITVRGKKYAWEYDYKREGINIGNDLVSGQQEPMVLVKDRVTTLRITSNDVNHAWWVPAFGVKKDAIIGRFNNTWFTPDRTGPFKGQCAELCGEGHGVMIISAVVVEPAQFEAWQMLMKHRDQAKKVWDALITWESGQSEDGLRAALATYRGKFPGDQQADFALQYWMAHNQTSYGRSAPLKGAKAEEQASFPQRFAEWERQKTLMKIRRERLGQIMAATIATIATTAIAPAISPAAAPIVAQAQE